MSWRHWVLLLAMLAIIWIVFFFQPFHRMRHTTISPITGDC